MLALHWLAEGHGYEITSADVLAAYASTMKAAGRTGEEAEVKETIRTVAATVQGSANVLAQVFFREPLP